ncbi:MAG TPA: nucleoside triphosphate pyrophosphohydrolase [Bryobacteraceae bacterium]
MSSSEPTANKLSPGEGFARLVAIMARLRAPGGCPWDREQNFDTIKPYLLEETYEVMDAIDARDFENLEDELGDLLLQAVFFAQMASEEGRFDISGSLEAINSKLVRRHPHVFAEGDAKTSDDVKRRWDEIKAEEKPHRPKGLLAGVPRSLPALVEAQRIAGRAAGAGFDWANIEQVFDKLREELTELDAARAGAKPEEIEDELGDLLFVVVNIARFLKVDPEQALRKTNAKFRGRFAHVEAGVEASGKTLPEAGIEEMERLWQEAKQLRNPAQGS